MSASETEKNQLNAGELLTQLREQQEMSIEEVSGKLHLEARIIAALEANNFEILPAATYARGYLRSYAKLLGADVEKIIALYDDDAQEAPEIIPEIKPPTQTSSTDKPVKAFSYFLSLVLVLLIIAWWRSDFIVETPTESTKDSSKINTPPLMEENYQLEDLAGAAIETADVKPANAEQLDASIEFIVPDPVAENSDETIEKVFITEELLSDASTVDVAPDSNLPDAEGEEPAPLQSRDIIHKHGAGPDEISITLNADSWVEVLGADGDELYLDLARNGQTLILNGIAPFLILLGFSEGAVITFNGEQIDHTPYSRASIAQFSVSSDGINIRE